MARVRGFRRNIEGDGLRRMEAPNDNAEIALYDGGALVSDLLSIFDVVVMV